MLPALFAGLQARPKAPILHSWTNKEATAYTIVKGTPLVPAKPSIRRSLEVVAYNQTMEVHPT